jgi:molybdenum cofactor cytidylyltransferase
VTTAAIVLAAGGGARFGGPTHKLLAPLHGRPVVAHAVSAAVEAGFDDVFVVVGAVELADVLPVGVSFVANPRWADGQATSVRAGIGAAAARGHDAVVIGLGDQPFIGPGPWRAVAACVDHPIAVASYEGRRRNPVRLSQEVWDLLPDTGDEGARALMRGRPDLVGEVPCQGTSADIDTAEDLAQWS